MTYIKNNKYNFKLIETVKNKEESKTENLRWKTKADKVDN